YRTYLIDGFSKPDLWPYGHFSKLKNDSIVLLVEGAWSVMNWVEHFGYDTNYVPFATLGTKLNSSIKQRLFEYPIIGILDNDGGGKIVKKQLQNWREEGIKTFTYTPRHESKVDEVLFGPLYVDDMNKNEMERLKKILDEIVRNKLSSRNRYIHLRTTSMDLPK
ncbi:MAG: hypothetical protein KC414_03485, partial [Romboutsia sp.]|nr:hypothetical protein [Romboutsia sp.]